MAAAVSAPVETVGEALAVMWRQQFFRFPEQTGAQSLSEQGLP
ncbi:hypothetical protein [Ralstonia pickettii]|nr:hypothetical protein [Ralstonia pickettii]